MSSESKSAYRSLVKGTSIFGGVQIINILINLLRGKMVALFLGTSGMGILSLFTVACSTIQQFASLGLNQAAVRDISIANVKGNIKEASEMVFAVRRMIRISATIGTLFTIIFSNWLSQITFGNEKYKWPFILSSIFVFFSLLSNGENSVLQGFRRLKSLAVRNIIGALSGLVFGTPLYYFFGEKGIVPALVISAFVVYLFAWYGTKEIGLIPVFQSFRGSVIICKSILLVGVLMSIADCLGGLTNYSILSFFRHYGSIEDVGLYNAANSLTGQYVSLVFTAMAVDYYPRLSGISHDREATKALVNQQSELLVLIVAPITSVVFIIAPLLISLLLTSEFMSIVGVVRFMGYGLIFKACCFPMGYLSLAKGDKVYYFLKEGIVSNIHTFIIFVLFYYWFGLIGLGYAAVFNSIFGVVLTSILTKCRYKIAFSRPFFRLALPLLMLQTCCFAFSFIENPYFSYGLMIISLIAISYYSCKELDKRISLKELINKKLLHKRV